VKKGVWIKKFLSELGAFLSVSSLLDLYCDNNGAIVQAKEPRNHQKNKHVLQKFHTREIVRRGMGIRYIIDYLNCKWKNVRNMSRKES
jgi:hypothetical protein